MPFRPWLLTALAARFVARTLVPSEGVAWVGDGQPFCLLWLLLGLATALASLQFGRLARRLDWIDGSLAVFVVLYSIAAIAGSTTGSPRPSINMLWDGLAMAVSFWLTRQLVQSGREARALVAVMLALAVVMSAYGYYQVFVGFPADRAEYARDPDGMLQRAGQWYTPGSPERAAFENRLKSTEPIATYALTNSLAGFLALWLTVALGLLVSGWKVAALFAVTIAGCLLLTKSRSGYVATALGTLLVMLPLARTPLARWWKPVAIGGLLIALGIAVAAVVGGVDGKIITEAKRSLGFRLEYWQATSRMIADHPLLGVGPGNFQDVYTHYKLPTASEEIRDPHNWLFEIAATAGLPALAVLLVTILGALVVMVRSPRNVATPIEASSTEWHLYGGAAVGFLAALVIGPLVGFPFGLEKFFGGLLVGGAAVALANRWVQTGTLSPRLLAIAAVVLLVNLLAAGGIMYPAVTGSLWLVLALGVNAAKPQVEVATGSKLLPVAMLLLFGSLAVLQYFTGYSPVLRGQGALAEAQSAEPGSTERERSLHNAAEADPWNADAWQELATLKLQVWLGRPGPRAMREFNEACQRMLELRPRSSSAYRLVGNWRLQIYAQTKTVADARAAAGALQKAVDLYPNSAILRAELASGLLAAGERAAALAEAKTALQLDAATPHADKKLPAEMRTKLQELTGSR